MRYTDEECREVLDKLNKLTGSLPVRQSIQSLLFTAAEIIEERLIPQPFVFTDEMAEDACRGYRNGINTPIDSWALRWAVRGAIAKYYRDQAAALTERTT